MGRAFIVAAAIVTAWGGGSRAGETVIVHLGDSITSTIYLKPDEKIDAVLQKDLAAAYPKAKFSNVNIARDGEWVEAFMKNRYDKVLRAKVKRADVFIIRYGTNDTQRDKKPPAFTRDLRSLIAKLKADYPGCSIVLGTGPHIKKLEWCNVHQYGPNWKAIRDLGKADSIPVVDIYARFEAEHKKPGVVLGKGDSPKDIHPNAKGVEITAEEVMKVLVPVLAARGVKAGGR